MKLNKYQEKAMATCMESSNNFSYMFLNLVGEVGETASKVAKAIRKNNAGIDDNRLKVTTSSMVPMERELKLEIGDVLWQVAGLCSVMGWNLQEIAEMNLAKLAARKEIGTIDGNGDGIIR